MMVYPIYLLLSSTKTWYKITNDHSFTEVKALGSYYTISEFSDDILPMRNHISDLIESEAISEVTHEEFEAHILDLKSTKTLREF